MNLWLLLIIMTIFTRIYFSTFYLSTDVHTYGWISQTQSSNAWSPCLGTSRLSGVGWKVQVKFVLIEEDPCVIHSYCRTHCTLLLEISALMRLYEWGSIYPTTIQSKSLWEDSIQMRSIGSAVKRSVTWWSYRNLRALSCSALPCGACQSWSERDWEIFSDSRL